MASVRLFNSIETDFTHNENVLSEMESCKVTEEINGDYTVELEYPLEDSKNISNNLVVGSVLSIPTIDNREEQLFRIIAKDTDSFSTIVQGQAKLLADLKTNAVKGLTIVGKTRKEAIKYVLDNTLEEHNYNVGDLDNNSNRDVLVNTEEGNPLNTIIGSENSILSEYGGEFVVNNSNLYIVDSRGSDNGVVIEYGKNLTSIKETIDNVDLATVLIPTCGDYRLPEYYVESPRVGAYEKRYFKFVEMNFDIWNGTGEKGEDQITKEEANVLMRQACNKMFTADKVDQLTFNYTIDFVELSKTEEYKDYAVLETVTLGDTVTVRHKRLNIDLQGRVNKISYRVNSEGNTSIDTVEIGFSRKSITDIINTTIRQIQVSKQEILLKVSNLDNTLSSEIKMTAESIRTEVKNTKDELNSSITQTAESIRTEVNNTREQLQSSIEQTAESIKTEVENLENDTNSQINQLSDEISLKVSKGRDFSSEMKQNVDAFQFLFNDASNGKTEINANGISVYSGGFRILDKNSNEVLTIRNDGVILADGINVDNLTVNNTEKGSAFYHTLTNMDEVSFEEVKTSRLTIDEDDFYITVNGDTGYTLREAILKILDQEGIS